MANGAACQQDKAPETRTISILDWLEGGSSSQPTCGQSPGFLREYSQYPRPPSAGDPTQIHQSHSLYVLSPVTTGKDCIQLLIVQEFF
jgi:hypothetical protein